MLVIKCHYSCMIVTQYSALRSSPYTSLKQGRYIINFFLALCATGSPRRRTHETLPGGFKMFRPLTRDLLLHDLNLPQTGPSRDPLSRPESLQARGNLQRRKGEVGRGGRGQGERRGHVTLPKLFRQQLPPVVSQSGGTPAAAVQLPHIVVSQGQQK